jgi:hypothetical protein
MKFTATECEDGLNVKIEADKELLDEFAKKENKSKVLVLPEYANQYRKNPTKGRCWMRRFIDLVENNGYHLDAVNVSADGTIDIYCVPAPVQNVIEDLNSCLAND